MAGLVPAHAVTLLVAWAVATRLGTFPAKKVLGWSWPAGFGPWKSAGLALLLFGAAIAITQTFGGQETELDKILRSSRATALITAVLAAVTAPLVEEVIYRGILYPAVQRLIGPVSAILVVTAMFAGLHVLQYRQNVGVIAAITVLSLVLTTVRARTGRLLPCYVIHLVFNGIQSLLIVFDPYLRTLYHQWRPEAEVSLLRFLVNFPG